MEPLSLWLPFFFLPAVAMFGFLAIAMLANYLDS